MNLPHSFTFFPPDNYVFWRDKSEYNKSEYIWSGLITGYLKDALVFLFAKCFLLLWRTITLNHPHNDIGSAIRNSDQ